MLSDTLSDAIAAIEDYQREMPDIYGDLADRIEPVKEAMARLMVLLDTNVEIPHDEWIEAFITRIQGHDPDLPPFGIAYRVRRADAVRALGEYHPLVLRLKEVEAGAIKRGVRFD